MGERSLLAICEFNLVRRDSKCFFLRCWTSSGAGGRTNQQYVETRDQCGQLRFRFTRKSPRRFCVIYCPSWNVLISVKIQLSGTAFSQTHKSRVCSFARKHVESGRPEHPNQDRKTMNWIWRFQPRCKKWSNGFFSGHRKDQSNQWQQNLQYIGGTMTPVAMMREYACAESQVSRNKKSCLGNLKIPWSLHLNLEFLQDSVMELPCK